MSERTKYVLNMVQICSKGLKSWRNNISIYLRILKQTILKYTVTIKQIHPEQLSGRRNYDFKKKWYSDLKKSNMRKNRSVQAPTAEHPGTFSPTTRSSHWASKWKIQEATGQVNDARGTYGLAVNTV